MTANAGSPFPAMEGSPATIYRIGTLAYTRLSLVSLFGWLLWGDFVFTFMEMVMPSLLPLVLKEHGASNREITTIVSSICLAVNSLMNPIISYQSDRVRSRWGRRRPFIFVTTPFVVLFLIAIPFAPSILDYREVANFIRLFSYIPISPLILVFGFLVAGFQVFNMFISTVYYYLIPDVVPREFLGRFLGLFRVFGSAAGIVFNYFVFGIADKHMETIFVATALSYGFFILLMCWRVKEGGYPPPLEESRGHWWSGIRNYARECFGHSYYWWVFLTYSALGWGGISGTFAVFFFRDEMGFSLDLIGKVAACSSFIFVLLCYPVGVLIDKWGSHKTLILGSSMVVASSVLMFFSAVNHTSTIVCSMMLNFFAAMSSMALMKWTFDVYPSDRYGQFGSAGALFSSIGGILAGLAFGWWMDRIKDYRYYLPWNAFFAGVGVVAALVVYRRWKKLGGPAGYNPP